MIQSASGFSCLYHGSDPVRPIEEADMKTFEERFWSKVRKGPGCWEWTGRKTNGYGRVWVGTGRKDKRYAGAHRVSWALSNGPISPGLMVCHTCDNRPCVRPSHLFLGTSFDNMRDCVLKKRHVNTKKNHCPRGHPYIASNLYINPQGSRNCLTCKRERGRRRYRALAALDHSRTPKEQKT